MYKSRKKFKVGLFSLTSCEGCYFGLLDVAQKFFDLADYVEFQNFRLFEEQFHARTEQFDLAFVEGSPLTSENVEDLQRLRQNSRILVALGSCSHIGGIYQLKNYQDKEKIFDHIYAGRAGIENLDVKSLSAYVKVDKVIPGCPVNPEEFIKFIYQFCRGIDFKITQNPVCLECQHAGYECVLLKGEICLGPITQGGCQAICLKSKQGCLGCRGLLEDAQKENLIKKLKENYTDREINKALEVFGVKEEMKKEA